MREWAARYAAYRQGRGGDPGPEPALDLQGHTVTANRLAEAIRNPRPALEVTFVVREEEV